MIVLLIKDLFTADPSSTCVCVCLYVSEYIRVCVPVGLYVCLRVYVWGRKRERERERWVIPLREECWTVLLMSLRNHRPVVLSLRSYFTKDRTWWGYGPSSHFMIPLTEELRDVGVSGLKSSVGHWPSKGYSRPLTPKATLCLSKQTKIPTGVPVKGVLTLFVPRNFSLLSSSLPLCFRHEFRVGSCSYLDTESKFNKKSHMINDKRIVWGRLLHKTKRSQNTGKQDGSTSDHLLFDSIVANHTIEGSRRHCLIMFDPSSFVVFQ